MGQDDRGHAQGDIQQHKENQQAHAHQDFRDGDRGQHQEGQQAQLVAVHGNAGQRAKKGGRQCRHHANHHRIARRHQHFAVIEQLMVPVQGEAHPLGVELGIVERIHHHDHQRQVQEHIGQRRRRPQPPGLSFSHVSASPSVCRAPRRRPDPPSAARRRSA